MTMRNTAMNIAPVSVEPARVDWHYRAVPSGSLKI